MPYLATAGGLVWITDAQFDAMRRATAERLGQQYREWVESAPEREREIALHLMRQEEARRAREAEQQRSCAEDEQRRKEERAAQEPAVERARRAIIAAQERAKAVARARKARETRRAQRTLDGDWTEQLNVQSWWGVIKGPPLQWTGVDGERFCGSAEEFHVIEPEVECGLWEEVH